jgi:hypothetical protein
LPPASFFYTTEMLFPPPVSPPPDLAAAQRSRIRKQFERNAGLMDAEEVERVITEGKGAGCRV